MVKILIDSQPDMIDVKNRLEQTPLFTAVDNGEFPFQMTIKCLYMLKHTNAKNQQMPSFVKLIDE